MAKKTGPFTERRIWTKRALATPGQLALTAQDRRAALAKTGRDAAMRINAQDVAAGTLLLVLAVIGLWLNQAHGLGTARRMGPGYLPLLVFGVQFGLGAAILGIGLFNGPAQIEPWPLREIALVIGAICAFGLLLERGGLMLAIAAAVGVSALADREQRPRGVFLNVLFLMALCWWVFVRQLQIRVPLWPQL